MGDEKKVLHMRKFDGGNRSPAEFFRQQVYANTKCSMCGGPPAMRIRFLAPVDEFQRREPEIYAALVLKMGGGDPSFPTTYGKMIHVESVFACDQCKQGARRAAAHKPDWVLCEFEEMGLEEKHPLIIQVAR